MLNVSKIVLALIVSVTLSYATDISRFNVDGLKVGLNISDFKKVLKCNSYEEDKYYVEYGNRNSPIKHINHKCKVGSSEYFIETDMDNKVYGFMKYIKLTSQPDWDSIIHRLENKYGKPDNIENYSNGKYSGKKLCWGNCQGYKNYFEVALHFYGNKIAFTRQNKIFDKKNTQRANLKWQKQQGIKEPKITF